jgi:hypothetical protein
MSHPNIQSRRPARRRSEQRAKRYVDTNADKQTVVSTPRAPWQTYFVGLMPRSITIVVRASNGVPAKTGFHPPFTRSGRKLRFGSGVHVHPAMVGLHVAIAFVMMGDSLVYPEGVACSMKSANCRSH